MLKMKRKWEGKGGKGKEGKRRERKRREELEYIYIA